MDTIDLQKAGRIVKSSHSHSLMLLVPCTAALHLHHRGDTLLLNNTLLLRIPRDPPIRFRKLAALHLAQEFLVVGDDNELEVLLIPPHLDDGVQ